MSLHRGAFLREMTISQFENEEYSESASLDITSSPRQFSFCDSLNSSNPGSISSISHTIDNFITKTFPFQPAKVLDLSDHTLEIIVLFLDQETAISLMKSHSKFLNSARKRLYKRLVVMEDLTEVRNAKWESSKPTTFVTGNQFMDCLDIVRFGDPSIGNMVEQIICFADLDWSSDNGNFTLNDSWYLTAPLLTSLKVVIWPKLPILKFQAFKMETRNYIKTLCVGFLKVEDDKLNSYDNLVLLFPKVENLIISLNENEDKDNIQLLSSLLIWGEVLANLKTLSIGADFSHGFSLNKVKSHWNDISEEKVISTRTSLTSSNPMTPVNQSVSQVKKLSLRERIKSIGSPTTPTSCSKVFNKGFSDTLTSPSQLMSPTTQLIERTSRNTDKTYSSLWFQVLNLLANQRKLKLESLTLDKVLLEEGDLEALVDLVELNQLKNLELSNSLFQYDEKDDKLELRDSVLSKLARYLKGLESLAIDIKFKCRSCHKDCYKYGKFEILEFLNGLKPLKNLHFVSHEIVDLKPEDLVKHRASLTRFSFYNPDRLSVMLKLVFMNLQTLELFWQSEDHNILRKQKESRMRFYLKNTVNYNILVDGCVTPNLHRLRSFNNSRGVIFNEFKYQMLNLFGGKLDEFDNYFECLSEISFFGIRFQIE